MKLDSELQGITKRKVQYLTANNSACLSLVKISRHTVSFIWLSDKKIFTVNLQNDCIYVAQETNANRMSLEAVQTSCSTLMIWWLYQASGSCNWFVEKLARRGTAHVLSISDKVKCTRSLA